MSSRTIDVDTKTFIRFWVVILGFVLLGAFIWKAATGILIVLASIFCAVALKPLANKIDNIDKSKKRSSLSSVLAVLAVVLGVVVIIGFVGPTIIGETSKFVSNFSGNFSKYIDSDKINTIGGKIGIDNLAGQIIDGISDAAKTILGNLSSLAVDSFSAITNFLTIAILIIVLTIMFMLQGPKVMENFWKLTARKSEKATSAWRQVVERMAEVVSKYVSGQLLVALLDGFVTAISVAILSFIFHFSIGLAIPMGLVALIFYLVPMFGPIITALLATLTISFSSVWAGATFLVFYIIYEQIENNVISPKIQGKGMDLPPLIILISIVIGMYTFGLIGCIIAIPIAGCIKVLIEEYPNLRLSSESGN